MEELSPSLDDEAKTFLADCDDAHYNILFIGNSITRHEITSYWWSDGRGMAATDSDHDYFHVLSNKIQNGLGTDIKSTRSVAADVTKLNAYDVNFSAWEMQGYDRAETLLTLNGFLSSNLDLVSIQLGENVTDMDSLEEGYEDLIRYVQDFCPDAKIVIVGEFWKDDAKDEIKKKACEATGATFVDLSAMFDVASYEAGMGTMVKDSDGNEHAINRQGVGMHPGDEGMKKIAELIWKAIKE